MKRQVYLKITGKVQGVFFRAETSAEARKLYLTGWVKNTRDGAVEVLAQGEENQLEELIEWCRKGPERAVIENIAVEWREPMEKFRIFSIE